MGAELFYLTASDGERIAIHHWKSEGKPRAILQISHGMAEFAMRYEIFADEAVSRGLEVFAADHRGHGETAGSLNKVGYLADKDGFTRVMEDQKELTDEINKRHPGTPVFLFGHSFGSFIAQLFIETYGDLLAGCILCGSKGPDPLITFFGKLAASLVCRFSGAKKPSALLHDLSFGSYNKKIRKPASPNSWISRDEIEVEKYDASPWTGFICTGGFYRDLTKGLSTIHTNKMLNRIPVNLPVFFISGTEDPVSNYGNTVKSLHYKYQERGIPADIKFYEGARHELLNETCRAEVSSNILDWIDENLANDKE